MTVTGSDLTAFISTHKLFYLISSRSHSCGGGGVREQLGGHLAAGQGQPMTILYVNMEELITTCKNILTPIQV